MDTLDEQLIFPVTWYAAAWSHELGQRPLKRRIAGMDLVFFRDATGQVHCLQAYCPHRGADLSLGHCSQNHLHCPFHGFEFQGDGTCVKIPSNPKKDIPDFAHARSYPALEKSQLIWVYPDANVNRDELPKLETMPELDDTDYVFSTYSAEWAAHLTRAVEINLDVAHLTFVHQKTMRRKSSPKVNLKTRVDGDSIFILTKGSEIEYRFPQQWILRPPEGYTLPKKTINYLTFTPIDRERTITFGFYGRNFAKRIPGMNRFFARFGSRVLLEDQIIAESQHPRSIPEALRMEAHVEADAPQVRFRQRWYAFLTGEEQKVQIQKQ